LLDGGSFRHGQDDDDVHQAERLAPVQDDFVAWMADGRVYVTENGCFAKTYGLNPRTSRRSTAR
jgi:hypothetical protein